MLEAIGIGCVMVYGIKALEWLLYNYNANYKERYDDVKKGW